MLCFILTGCSLNNTPKAKVETLLMKYKKNSDIMEQVKFLKERYLTNTKITLDIDFNPNNI